jgi:hypothetical protein
MVVAVSSGAKGLYALGIVSHEASIIATKERAEMKMIELFIPRKLVLLVLTAAFNHTALCAVKRAGIVDDIGTGQRDHPAIIGAAGAILSAGRVGREEKCESNTKRRAIKS